MNPDQSERKPPRCSACYGRGERIVNGYSHRTEPCPLCKGFGFDVRRVLREWEALPDPALCEWCKSATGNNVCATADRTIYACSNYVEKAASS